LCFYCQPCRSFWQVWCAGVYREILANETYTDTNTDTNTDDNVLWAVFIQLPQVARGDVVLCCVSPDVVFMEYLYWRISAGHTAGRQRHNNDCNLFLVG